MEPLVPVCNRSVIPYEVGERSTKMADQQVEPKVFQFPTNVREAFEQLEVAQTDEKRLKKRISGLKGFLGKSIPMDMEKDGKAFGMKEGVLNLSYSKRYTSWSQACGIIVEQLVPEKRRQDAEDIIDQNTKASLVPKFGREEQDDFPTV
jgi:hypothetical protein